MNKLTIYECLVKWGIPESRIEKLVVKDNYVEYRIWDPCSICHNGETYKYGRRCKVKYLATPDEMDLVFDESYFVKDEDTEFWTEDYEFYKQQTGVEPSEIDWSKQKEIKHPKI